MALQMRVYAEIASVEAKVMWGMGWRQLAASALMLVLGGGEVAVFFLMLDQPDLGSYLLFVVCLPPALWGWWRPKGLKPERYLGCMLRLFLVKSVFRVGGGDVLLDFVVCMVVGQCTGWFQATSPSWMRLSMMLMPYSVLMRLSRYQTMYSSSIAVNSSIVTPWKLLLWKNSCLRRPKNPSAAALSGEQPFALIDRVSPCSVQMRIHSGHR